MKLTLDDSPFGGRTGAGVTVAVLDSGIHPEHPHIGGVQRGMNFAEQRDPNDWHDRFGHGTAVAAAIREKSPGVDLIAVRVFGRELATNVATLAEAIAWSADAGAKLINVSLGTANAAHADVLDDAIQHAASRGGIVISPRDANGVNWLPGSLSRVAAVIADWECNRDVLEVTPRPADFPLFAASAYPRPIPGVPRERNVSGVSFAVANVTGFLARATEAANGDPLAAIHML